MSKVKRQDDLYEKYKTTSDWVSDFSKNLEKNAEHIDYLKDYFNKQRIKKKYTTIDEKLNDIKARIGFNLIQKLSFDDDKDDSGQKFAEQKITTASDKTQDKNNDIELMTKILKYAKDICSNEKHLSTIEVVNKLRQVEDFFDFLNKRVDNDKLKKYIDSLILKNDLYNTKTDAEYIAPTSDSDAADVSEIWNHAQPGKS